MPDPLHRLGIEPGLAQREAQQLARALVGAGVVKGARVAVYMANRPELVAATYAVGRVGGVLVPISTFASPAERDYILRHSDASLLLMQPSLLKHAFLDDLRAAHPEIASGAPGRLRCPALPAPLHLAAGLMTMRGLGLLSKASALRAGLLLRGEVDRPDDNETCDAWLRRLGQTQGIRGAFWDPLIWAVLNDDPLVASAAMLVAVLERAFLGTRDASRLGVPRLPLSRLYVDDAVTHLRRGRLARGVVALTFDDGFGVDRLAGVCFEDVGEPVDDLRVQRLVHVRLLLQRIELEQRLVAQLEEALPLRALFLAHLDAGRRWQQMMPARIAPPSRRACACSTGVSGRSSCCSSRAGGTWRRSRTTPPTSTCCTRGTRPPAS